MNGEWVTATRPAQNDPWRISTRNLRCHGTERDNSGSSIRTKYRLFPERYRWLNSETICFSPEERSLSWMPFPPGRLFFGTMETLNVAPSYTKRLSTMYSEQRSQKAEMSRSRA